MLIQQPVAVHHVARVKVVHAETLHEVGAVFHQLHHLPAHVEMFVQPHSKAAGVLKRAEGSKGHIIHHQALKNYYYDILENSFYNLLLDVNTESTHKSTVTIKLP